MLDVRRLRLLRELSARGTVTAVAEALSYTPSAVSQQLAALERDAGVPLLERVGRGVRLTDAGRRLVFHADAVLARLEEAEADLAAAGGAVAGRVRVCSFQTAAFELARPALTALKTEHPDVRGELLEDEAETALPALRLGDVDLVVAEEYDHAPRPRLSGLEHVDLCRDPLRIALPGGHPLAHLDAVPLAELGGEQWTTAREGTLFSDMLARACRSIGGYEPEVRHRANDVRLLYEMVEHERTVALVPSLGHPDPARDIVILPVAEEPLERRIFTAVRAGTAERPAIRAFRRALATRAAELGLVAAA
jgi:DNA-binding transcriptional LysR family regulator